MRSTITAICCLLVVAGAAIAQSDRGTITGTVSDPAGAVIAGAAIELKNINTGAIYQAQSSSTGNYTIGQLPAGKYQMSSSVPGFKQFIRTGITVLVAQTLRIDISLEVGAISETVTVNADAPLLRTESGELATNVAGSTLNELPILGFSGYIRDPYAAVQLIPGALYGSGTIRMVGSPANTQGIRVEGQDSTNGLFLNMTMFNQPGADAVEEIAVQTSNFAAEYGQAGGGMLNMTMKSGTNKLHGSAYDYWYNEAFNASSPYGRKDRQRRHDYGFTAGGPVYIPKVYDGRDKTFFFFNFEQLREKSVDNNTTYTVPTLKMRQGDFSEVFTGATVKTADGVTTILQNQLYKPGTEHTYIGLDGKSYLMRDPYPNNVLTDPFDSVALAIQNNYIPEPAGPYKDNLTDNYLVPWDKYNYRTIPSVKIDHNFGTRSKLSGYWAAVRNSSNQIDCDALYLISPATACRVSVTRTQTVRLNYDFSLTPTKLLHLGAGYQVVRFFQDAKPFDQQEIGLPQPKGAEADYFPHFTGLSTAYGGMFVNIVGVGPATLQSRRMDKPTANASLTWVKSNHTYKFGAELRIEGYPTRLVQPSNGRFTFSSTQTGIPDSAYVKTLSVGFPYASFLLGQFNNGSIGAMATPRVGKSSWALFAQDSWKASRKFTLDYGLRWDYQGYLRETYGRVANFSPTTPNPNVGNLPGAMIFERNGVKFADVYAFAFGPRLGAAYKITPKTVFRGGFGISYGQTASDNGAMVTSGSAATPYSAPYYGAAWRMLNQGAPESPTGMYVWPNVDPGYLNTSPTPVTTSPPAWDHNAGRPPRQIQWSISLQREITRDLMVEASYIGNRGAWWEGNELIAVNAISAERLASFGLSLDRLDDRTLLAGTMNSPAAKNRINPVTNLPFSTPPYPGFPTGQTVAQSLRPFPHFTTINYRWSPLGRTWFDALQAKVTKRYSHGLDFSSSFTWQKELVMGSEITGTQTGGTGGVVNNVFDRKVNKYMSTYSRPIVWTTSLNYMLPKLAVNKVLSMAIRDWSIGLVLDYSSGRLIQVPAASSTSVTSLYTFQNTFANRVAGQPLFLRTVRNADGTKSTMPLDTLNNRGAFDPLTDFVFNPAAWQDPPAGQYSTAAAFYSDYRYPRHPSEKLSIGRIFRLGEGATLSIRADFINILNRMVLGDPLLTRTPANATQTWSSSGITSSGFGRYNATAANAQRNGSIVARIQF
ncbi:MAG: TonB-dependent receptor [Acidobacteria bacterium]|nr:TonB-dependent receptor [Acidobacteriota bacterium]